MDDSDEDDFQKKSTQAAPGKAAAKKPNLLDTDESDEDTFVPASKQSVVQKN